MRRRLIYAAVLLYSLLHFALTGVRQPLANFYGDFLASFPAWKVALLAGRLDFYAGSLAQKWGPPPIWHYGPIEHLITLPLFAFPTLRAAYIAWLFVNFVFVAVTAWIAARVVGERGTLAAIIIFCNFNPLYEALTQRTIEIFELMLLFAAYAFYRRGRDSACGVALGVAVMAKFLPLIYLPWLVLKRRWRALGAALAVIVPVAIATQLVLGWQNSGIVLQLREGSFINSILNQSLSGAVLRVAAWTHASISVPAISRVLIVASLIALSALMLRVRRREGVEELEFGLLALAMVLLPPHNENYYFIFLLLPYVFLYARYRRQPWSWRSTLAALSFALVAMPVPFSLLQRLTGRDAFDLYLRAGIPFIGAALLAIVLVAELGMSYAVSASEQSCPSKKPSRISALS
jgi:hypothetical protein